MLSREEEPSSGTGWCSRTPLVLFGRRKEKSKATKKVNEMMSENFDKQMELLYEQYEAKHNEKIDILSQISKQV